MAIHDPMLFIPEFRRQIMEGEKARNLLFRTLLDNMAEQPTKRWPWPKSPESKSEPRFDAEAYRQFMRGLG